MQQLSVRRSRSRSTTSPTSIDRRLGRAAAFCAVAAALTSIGLIHSTLPSGSLYLPWDSGSNESLLLTAAYASVALVFLVARAVTTDPIKAH